VRVFSTSNDPSTCEGLGGTPCAYATSADVVAGLNQVLAEDGHYHFAAVNLSLGIKTPCSGPDPMSVAIAALHDAGIGVVVASGNDGDPNGIAWPACLPDAVSVGSVSPAGTVSVFTDASAQLTLLAPGEGIVSSLPGGAFGPMTGTSMAAPVVSGAFALLRQASPTTSLDALTATMRSTGTATADTRPGAPPGAAYPAINIAAALATVGAAPPTAPAPPKASFLALNSPSRVVDTRIGVGGGRLPAGSVLAVTLAGVAGVPASGAAAVSLNLTAVGASGPGYLSVYPCGGAPPLVSSVNYAGPAPVANKAVVALGPSGSVCVKTLQAVDAVVDVDGWLPADGPFQPVVPYRAIDTRVAGGRTTDIAVQAAPAGSIGAIVNATVTDPAADGFATVYPCGQAAPLASNVNFLKNQTVPGASVVGVDASGRVCVHTNVASNLVVDVFGVLGKGFTALTPTRLLDTRTRVPVTDVAVPVGTTSPVALNVTVTQPTGDGFVTVYPCGQSVPLASNVNFTAGATVANAVLARPGAGNQVCVHAMVRTHLVVDLDGVMA
jgi:hypothetical protein